MEPELAKRRMPLGFKSMIRGVGASFLSQATLSGCTTVPREVAKEKFSGAPPATVSDWRSLKSVLPNSIQVNEDSERQTLTRLFRIVKI